MTIQSTNAIEPIANYPMIIEGESSILEEVDELIKQYDAKPLMRAEIATSAKQLIEKFNRLVEENLEQNLPLAREGLCRFLKLNIEEVQLEALSSLQSLLHLNYLDHDIQNNSFNSLLVLEKQISQALDTSLQSKSSSKITPALLVTYQSILERLWILPHLVENTSDAIILLQENSSSIINKFKSWIKLLTEEATHNLDLDLPIKRIQEMFQMLESNASLNKLKAKEEICKHIGNAYNSLGKYSKAINFHEKALYVAQEAKDKDGVGRSYGNLGNAYESMGEYQKAINFHEKHLQIAQELEDRAGESRAYGNIGISYSSLGKYRKAIKFHEKSLQICIEIEDKAGEGRAYSNFGNIYESTGEYRKAIEFHEKDLQIAQELEDREGIGMTYGNLGNAYESIGEYCKAIDFYKKRLQIAQELKDRAGEGRAYGNLGNAYDSLGEYRKAIEFHDKRLKIAQELEDRVGEGRAYSGFGNAYDSLGEYRKAIEFHKKHLQISKKFEDINGTGIAYSNLGNSYQALNEYQKAIKYYEKSLKISQDIEDINGIGIAYGNLGNSYQALGEYRKAIDFYENSLKISRDIEDIKSIGIAYGNLGNTYDSLGEYRKSLEFQEKSLQIFKTIEDKSSVGKSYGSIGNVYQSLGEYQRAIDFYEKRLQIAIELEDREGEGNAYCNIGHAYYFIEKSSKSIEFHEKSLQICIEIEDREGEGRAYGNLGNVYNLISEHKKAIEFHKKDLKIAQEINNKEGVSRAYGNLGNAYESIEEYLKAIEFHKKDLKIAQEIEDRNGQAITYHNLGLLYQKKYSDKENIQNFDQSEDFFWRSINLYSNLQNELGENSEWKISIFEDQSMTYLALESLLIRRGKIEDSLNITDTRRSRALVSSISKKNSKSALLVFSNFLTVNQMQELAQKLQTTFIIYSSSAIKKDKMSAWIIPSQGEISFYSMNWEEKLSNQLSDLVKEVENLSSIKRGGSDELDFDLDDLDLEAELASLNSDPEVEKLAASKQAEKIEKDQNALKKLKQEKLRPWYDLLIAPLESALPAHGSSITIIPDGVLSQFPFGAFCDKQGTYLIEKYAISLAPSIKTLQLLHQLPQEFPATSLVVGSPDTGNSKDYLEVADREAVAVSNLINGSQLLSKKQATISHVSQQMQEARFIHLACHGLAEKKYDKHSVFEGLFKLAPDESDSKGELYAQQIAALNLKAELVFLSACYSGKGNVKQEGSIGPVWSFLGAGAKSTVATYWPLPDSATTFEMVESFYKEILNTDRASLNKAQVLRQVTLKAMEKNRDDFIQWGAFFLSGVSIDAKLD